MVDRRPIKLLPGVNQTDTLTKFFAATVDHLFQPESVEFISAYIGSRPPYYDPSKDFYVSEPTKNRNNYQLPVTALSKNLDSGKLTNIMFYDDYINLLRYHGANTQNASRLFNEEYYSWSPPIDLDKLLNYTKYYWIPTGPEPISLLSQTDLLADAVGHESYTYNGTWQLTNGEIKTGSLTFSTGLVIRPTNDVTLSINGLIKCVNNVGRAIELIDLPPVINPNWDTLPWDTQAWDGSNTIYEKQYVTIGRQLHPTNQWSSSNRWYHEDVLLASGTVLTASFQARARRPIIEFEPNLQLYNSGWIPRPSVTVVATASNITQLVGVTQVPIAGSNFMDIVGLANVWIDGYSLADGDTILVTAASDSLVNNRVYQVSGLDTLGVISLTEVGSFPLYGETLGAQFGVAFGGKQLWYNGTAWVLGQQKTAGTLPLFMLYDQSGIALDDVGSYPSSTFRGSTIFQYAIDLKATLDSELGIRPKTDQFGNFVYNNTLVTQRYTYLYNTAQTGIVGYYYFLNRLPDGPSYNNGWYKSPELSRQYIVNDFSIASKTYRLPIDQVPDPNPGLLPSIYVEKIKDQSATLLVNGKDYAVNGRILSLAVPAMPGERIVVRSWAQGVPQGNLGYYELPLNLTANPNNDEITTVSQSQLLNQFAEIIGNQPGFQGQALGSNNWRDTKQIRGLGLSILQHRAPLPRTMVLSSSNVTVGINSVQSDTDPMLAMQYSQREYVRFYNRFVTTLFKLQENGFGAQQNPEDWVNAALKQINLGKTPASPFANSGPSATQGAYCNSKATAPTYVPPTATRLGCAPAWQPLVYLENTHLWIQCHDGARIVMAKNSLPLGTIMFDQTSTSSPALLTDPVAAAWLQFELDLFNNIPDRYRDPQATLAMNITRYLPGKWRAGEYTRDEFIEIQRPMFDKWAITAQVDWRANTTYNVDDQFTYNYRSVTDLDGFPVPGYWQGIYRWFYDTDRPHTHPWEMLGFSQMPPWWTSEYGPSPYTSGNTYMWSDLAAGRIRQGPRAGIDPTYRRPGLLSCIPVDDQGALLPPLAAGTVRALPSGGLAEDEWIFGDGAPVETVWFYSNDYNFVIAEYSYLMKPAQFIEYNWDTIRTTEVFPDQETAQWIYVDTDDRRMFNQYYVHRENPSAIGGNINIANESTLTYYGSCGVQHWISEYLVGRNLAVTQYFGNIMRGVTVQLAHQMGGFVSSNLYLTADSFGQIGYTSQIVPTENVNTYLYKSAGIRTSFYTGVIITQVRDGYRVVGYDGIKQYFEIIPSNVNGQKSTVVVGKERVIWYKQGSNFITAIPYGTVLGTKQAVFDFLISLQRFQQLSGWQFDGYDPEGNYTLDWTQAGKEFLFWSQGNWANGNFIALSPLATKAVFRQRLGQTQFVSGIVGGTYPVVDKTGSPIEGQNIEVLRYDDLVTINPLGNQAIYGMRLYANTLESVIVIDNITSFNDVVYDPLFDQAQPRLKLFAYKTNNWTGRVDAPGYFLYQDGTSNQWNLVPNFEKTANDFRKYFNIEQPKNFTTVDPVSGNLVVSGTELAVVDVQAISEISKHQIGYQQRGYLQNLLLEDTTEFQFYQGFIRQKGTKGTINRILRNDSVVPVNSDFQYYEEYAFRASRFGSTALNTGIDFVIPQNQYINNPQQITVYGTQSSDREIDGVIVLIPDDPKIVVPPTSYSSPTDPLFPLRASPEPDYTTDLPTAGYVQLGETDYTVTNVAALNTLWSDQLLAETPLVSGDTVWQLITPNQSWTVWQYNKSNLNVVNTTPSTFQGGPTIINVSGNLGLSNGDTVVLEGISNVTALIGTWTVGNVSASGTSFTVPTFTYTIGAGGNIYVYDRVRFADETDRDLNPPTNGWQTGDRAWVDTSTYGINGWTVYDYLDGSWLPVRSEDLQVNASLMLQAKLYNQSTLQVYGNLEYYDPAKGLILGAAKRYLDFMTIYDPAVYNTGDPLVDPIDAGRAWGPEHVGETWWNLSAVRYVDYEQGSTAYRWQNWGKIAPGTTVDVYEWVGSPVTPTDWDSYVTSGQTFAQFNISYAPTGETYNKGNTAYTVTTTFNAAGGATSMYYFWVKNSTTVPLPTDRSLTTYEIANIIRNPNGAGIPWYAAIDQRNIIVANIGRFLNANQTVLSLLYTHTANEQVDYKQWDLLREGDPNSLPDDYYWTKLTDSLTGKDGLQNNVPDPYLSNLTRYGTLIRPRQSWFVDREAAAQTYVNTSNIWLQQTLLVVDSSRDTWVDYFDLAEPPPAADYTVGSISSRNGLGGIIEDGSTVLVLAGPDTDNLWILYRYNFNAGNYLWTSLQVQAYNTPNYWHYVDWYLTTAGVNANTIPNYTVSTKADRAQYAGTEGVIVKVLDNGQGSWALYKWTAGEWVTVGYQNGTIQIYSGIYDGSINTMLFGTTPFDSVGFDIYPWREFTNIINGLLNVVFKDLSPSGRGGSYVLNNLFFTMVNFVLNEQKFVDWIFKTSYIVLNGFNIPLSTSELYKPDNTQALLDYINEAKPYHVKIREFISGRSWQDDANIYVTDFDNVKIGSTSYTSNAWKNNYINNPELIRTLKIKLLFDRIVSTPVGWSSYKWESTGWEFENHTYESYIPWGAWTRIRDFYDPGPDMIRKDDPNLIPGSDYRGIILDGIGFRYQPGWDVAPWNTPVGWSADAISYNEYLDVIIQGGQVPPYDRYYGTGSKTAFKLNRIPQDPALVVVWSDMVLRDYGVDWIIPNWVTSATVYDAGIGYSIGDTLWLDISPSVAPTILTVTGVDGIGGITTVAIADKGRYDIWPGGVVTAMYPPYVTGTGAGALFIPAWGGDTIVFNTAPSSNAAPNVFILYVGTTFLPAPTGPLDIINDGNQFIQPYVDEDHAEERYAVKLPESIRIDTHTQAVGGAPVVYMRVYKPDGVMDHFPLGIAPMDASAVIAQLDGLLLRYGLPYDYIINWETNEMVFLVPPTGETLQLLTIGVGGTGTGIYATQVIDPGVNYQPGDIVTLAGGATVNNDAGQVQVTSVQASNVTIVSAGTGYVVGDIFVLQDDYATSKTYATQIVVNTVTPNGVITGVQISQAGDYTYTPATQTWLSSSNGSGADFAVLWGCKNVVRSNTGTYSLQPTAPIQQETTSGVGTGATFGSLYTSILGHNTFTGDGVTTTFSVDVGPENDDAGNMLVTQSGAVLQDGVSGVSITVSGNLITISPAPALNTVVSITTFSNNDFSVVADNEILGQTNVYSYQLDTPPYSTLPPYLSTTVAKNGLALIGPPMASYIGTGYTTTYAASYMPPNPADLLVYDQNYLMTYGVDYTIVGDDVIFYTPPAADHVIALVTVDADYGWNYVIQNGYMIFQTSPPLGWGSGAWNNYYGFSPANPGPIYGDVFKVVTYSQDISYKFRSEQFIGPMYPMVDPNVPGQYVLMDEPWNDSTLMVWVNKEMQTLLYDYRLDRIDALPGWSETAWDAWPWGAEYANAKVIRFTGNVGVGTSDVINVQYMSALPERPGTTFRLLSNGNAVVTATAINPTRETILLSAVTSSSDSIEVADYTVLSQPDLYTPGTIWIGDERISFWEVQPAPTTQYPNRARLTTLQRGTLNTPSGNVSTLYDTIFYDGDGSRVYFPTIAGTEPAGGPEVVYINTAIQINSAVDSESGTYSIVSNPPYQPAGRYIAFDTAPPVGWRNVKIAAPRAEAIVNSHISHPVGSKVIDAGAAVTIPGGYNWEAAPNGLQYNDTVLAKFLLNNAEIGY